MRWLFAVVKRSSHQQSDGEKGVVVSPRESGSKDKEMCSHPPFLLFTIHPSLRLIFLMPAFPRA